MIQLLKKIGEKLNPKTHNGFFYNMQEDQMYLNNEGDTIPVLNGGFNRQKWVDVKAQRDFGVVYTNTEPYPIIVNISVVPDNVNGTLSLQFYVDGLKVVFEGSGTVGSDKAGRRSISTVVPSGSSYMLETYKNQTIELWAELR